MVFGCVVLVFVTVPGPCLGPGGAPSFVIFYGFITWQCHRGGPYNYNATNHGLYSAQSVQIYAPTINISFYYGQREGRLSLSQSVVVVCVELSPIVGQPNETRLVISCETVALVIGLKVTAIYRAPCNLIATAPGGLFPCSAHFSGSEYSVHVEVDTCYYVYFILIATIDEEDGKPSWKWLGTWTPDAKRWTAIGWMCSWVGGPSMNACSRYQVEPNYRVGEHNVNTL